MRIAHGSTPDDDDDDVIVRPRSFLFFILFTTIHFAIISNTILWCGGTHVHSSFSENIITIINDNDHNNHVDDDNNRNASTSQNTSAGSKVDIVLTIIIIIIIIITFLVALLSAESHVGILLEKLEAIQRSSSVFVLPDRPRNGEQGRRQEETTKEGRH